MNQLELNGQVSMVTTAVLLFGSYNVGFCEESQATARLAYETQAGVDTAITSFYTKATWNAVQEKLSELARLEDDWDGEDALAPSSDTINSMKLFVNYLDRCLYYAGTPPTTPDCFATPTGGVELSWRGNQFFLSALVETDTPGRIIVLDGDGITRSHYYEWECPDAARYIAKRLSDLADRHQGQRG